MRQILPGEWIERGHGAMMRALLDRNDRDTRIVSRGEDFYNASDFPLLTLIMFMLSKLKGCAPAPTTFDLQVFWKEAKPTVSRSKEIVIAVTPPKVTRDYVEILDGGIIHEAFHSLFTVRGFSVDIPRLEKIFQDHWDPEVDYAAKKSLFKSLWNIFEDAMIEQRGLKVWPEAAIPLERVHRHVWEREALSRDAWKPISHVTCYLRDIIEPWKDAAPLEAYDAQARQFVDEKLQREVADSKNSQDSYDTLALTLRTLSILNQEPDELQEEDPNEDSESTSGSSQGDGEASEEPSEGQESGEASGSPQNGENEAQGSNSNSGGSGEPLKDATETEMMEPSDALKDEVDAGHVSDGGQLRKPRPMDPSKDERFSASSDPGRIYEVQRMRDRLLPHLGSFKTRLALLLRGEKKVRKLRHLKRGRRMSSRSMASLVTDVVPKPFEQRTATKRLHTAVQVVLDESSSMRRKPGAEMAMSIALTLADLQIPWSLTGFQDSAWCPEVYDEVGRATGEAASQVQRRLAGKFTRENRCIFRTYHDYNDNNSDETLTKLLQTQKQGNTPLIDGMWEGAQRLRRRKEPRRLLIVVTDGEGNSISYGNDFSKRWDRAPGRSILNNMIEDLVREGIDVLVVGFGTSVEYITEGHYIQAKTIPEFATEVNEWLLSRMHGQGPCNWS